MKELLLSELLAVFASFYGGLCGGILYLPLNALRRRLGGKLMGHALDLCILLLLAALLVVTLLYVSGGAIRLYQCLCIGLGFAAPLRLSAAIRKKRRESGIHFD